LLILLLKAYLAGGPPWPVLPLVLASWTPQFALEKHLVSHFFIEETVRTGRIGRGEDALVEVRRSSSLLRNSDQFINDYLQVNRTVKVTINDRTSSLEGASHDGCPAMALRVDSRSLA